MLMKIVLLNIWVLFTLNSLGQNEQTNHCNEIRIDIGCGGVGITSYEIYEIKKLAKSMDTSQLLKYISNDNINLQLLSIIEIDNLLKRKKISLSDSQLILINLFKKKNNSVFVCNGCIGSHRSTIENLFTDPKNEVRELINFSIEKRK